MSILYRPGLAAIVFLALTAGLDAVKKPALTEHELTTLKACQGIVRLFKQYPDQIWPGFNLAARPVLVYIPGKWALLLNPPREATEFSALPPGWPNLGTKAGYYPGQFRDLIGQLVFDFPVGKSKTVAVGILENHFESLGPKTAMIFGYIVHEAFHQFQSEAFGEIPWEREERYPILNPDNSALAALEMDLLRDAVDRAFRDRKEESVELLKMFVAVRTKRWGQAPPFVARYEQGQEVREGTASYVEKKSLQLAQTLKFDSSLSPLTGPLHQDLGMLPIQEIFQKDFAGRLTEDAVAPDNMIRNRIYPLGSALGFLADPFGPAWKQDLAHNTMTFSFSGYFRDKLGINETDLNLLVEEAKRRYAFNRVSESTEKLIADYKNGFATDMAGFASQAGTGMRIRLQYRSISRSRSSAGRVWVMDDGAKTLLTKVRVYTLKTEGFALQIQDSAVYEENEWDKKIREIDFFVQDLKRIIIDGADIEKLENGRSVAFKSIELGGENFTFSSSLPGRITGEGGQVKIDLLPFSPE